MQRNGLRLMKRIHWRWTLPASVALALVPTSAWALVPTSAWAHADVHPGGGFVAGLLHPISGLDHVVAMVAVGLWGAVLGPPALWVLPVAFPMVMAFGGLLGLLGVPIPGVEIGIAVSGLVMGLMVLFELKPPLWLAALIVASFAVFHGHAHGAELPDGSNALLYSLAFVMATGLLHLVGILLGETRRWPGGRRFVQGAGGCVSLVGLWFLEQALT
ncbi:MULTISPECIES: HupE/UreJ family protein [unclassified Synechococcus]|uniref:HupE/UreJ family protein n=1 Tax=unclassified Synechococcus TaxID=2626047 RepID=UPI00006988D1|nr:MULTISPECIES: HupE/UreJ family protein [unclassified Synechococcus]EAQ74718.1 nickel-iron hydrogenase, accessory protein [Synechococcus sp. WH 5701]WFN58123.1 HupE/UreJ family protein [Synechococcus sp. CCFWC 502]